MPPTDSKTLTAWRKHRNADAFAELVACHAGMVFGTCKRLLKSQSEAEDVAQECFIKLATQSSHIESVGGWLHQVAVRSSLDRLRTLKRLHLREVQYATEQNRYVSKPDNWDDILPLIDEAINALPDDLQTAIVLRFLEGQTHAQMAAQWGVSRRTVQKRIDRGLIALRTFLTERGIITTATLSTLLLANLSAEAAPLALTQIIGKNILAIAQQMPGACTTSLVTKGMLFMSAKKSTITVIAAIILLVGILLPGALTSIFDSDGGENNTETDEPARLAEPDVASTSASTSSTTADPVNEQTEAVAAPDNSTAEGSGTESPPRSEEPLETPKTTELVRISGIVKSDDAFPIPDATVQVTVFDDSGAASEKYGSTTSSDGRFQLADVPMSTLFMFNVRAKGYLSTHQGIQHDKTVRSLQNLEFLLTPTDHFIAGVVVNGDGEAVAGAEVSLIKITTVEGGSGYTQSMTPGSVFTVSDDAGEFEVPIPAAGTCTLHVKSEGYSDGYFPNIESDTRDARLELSGFSSISGRVILPDGTPAVGYTVTVMAECPLEASFRAYSPVPPKNVTRTDADGAYLIDGLSPSVLYAIGTYRLSSEEIERQWAEQRSMPLVYRDDLQLEAGETLTGIDLQLVENPQVRIHGHVRDRDTGRPAVYVNMSAQKRDPHRLLDVITTDETGAYDLEFTTTETMTIFVLSAYVSLLGASGGTELTPADGSASNELSVSPGDELEKDFTVLAPFTIPVAVVDLGGQPLPGLHVSVGTVPYGELWETRTSSAVPTDENGQVLLKGLPPNKTYFIWVRGGEGSELRPPRAMSLAEYGPVNGEPGETLEQVVLVVQPKGGIEGAIVDANGTAISESFLVVESPETGQKVHMKSNAGGGFAAVYALKPGVYQSLRITALANGRIVAADVPNVTIAEDTITDLGMLTLTPISE